MKKDRPKTLFIDIDGTLLYHHGVANQQSKLPPKVLPGVLKRFGEWDFYGYNIILITGRRESERELTERQLNDIGIVYDKLIMGIGGGDRIIINDTKPDSNAPTAFAINVERNIGIENIEI